MDRGGSIALAAAAALFLAAIPPLAQEEDGEQFQVELGRSAEEYFNIGNWYSERDQHFRAIAYYRAAVERREDFAEAWINLGVSLRAIDRYQEAIDAYRTAIDLDCEENFVYLNLGNALVAAGRLREAVLQFRTFVNLEPYDPDGYANLGLTLLRLSDHAEAAAAFERLLILRQDDVYFLYQAARCYALLSRYEEATEKLRRALRLDPNLRAFFLNDDDFRGFRRSSQYRQLLAEISP